MKTLITLILILAFVGCGSDSPTQPPQQVSFTVDPCAGIEPTKDNADDVCRMHGFIVATSYSVNTSAICGEFASGGEFLSGVVCYGESE